jgi:hypothetical protein
MGEMPEASELVYMNVYEAAQLWQGIMGEEMTLDGYKARCASGELERMGVELRHEGESWLTDMDSLLAALDARISGQYQRIKEALEERRLELEGF